MHIEAAYRSEDVATGHSAILVIDEKPEYRFGFDCPEADGVTYPDGILPILFIKEDIDMLVQSFHLSGTNDLVPVKFLVMAMLCDYVRRNN